MILKAVGQGGMGAVYKAVDLQLHQRIVAIKEMSQNGLTGQDLQEAIVAFTHEAEMLARLKHAGLPHIYEQFEDQGRRYLVMEFIEGETLEDRLEKVHKQGSRLSVAQVIDIGKQLCTVLDYLHSQQPPIIFRDLKPSNIMLGPQGQVYLIDFGIARLFKPGASKDTVALGSPGYAPPEQYRKATSPRSDIYSLGATMHRMLTGEDPSSHPFLFKPFSVNVPRLEQLVQSMVALDESQRPACMRAVQDVLDTLVLHNHQPVLLKGQSHKKNQLTTTAPASRHKPALARNAGTRGPLTISVVLSDHPDDLLLWTRICGQLLALIDGFPTVQVKVDVHGQAKTVENANLVLLLLSNDFLSSLDCMESATRAMDRHNMREMELLSVILRSCAYKNGRLAQIRAIPDDAVAHLSPYAQEQRVLEVAEAIRTLLVACIVAGRQSGPMNLLQWLLWQLYGNGLETCRYFLTGKYALKHIRPAGLARILLCLFDLQQGRAVTEYLIGPLHCKDLTHLLHTIAPFTTDPEAVQGNATNRKPAQSFLQAKSRIYI